MRDTAGTARPSVAVVFTRFITPQRPPTGRTATGVTITVVGRSVTQAPERGAEVLALHPDLAEIAEHADPQHTFDKTTHDAFASDGFSGVRRRRQPPSALVLFGIETDVCVLATALSAVDLGMARRGGQRCRGQLRAGRRTERVSICYCRASTNRSKSPPAAPVLNAWESG